MNSGGARLSVFHPGTKAMQTKPIPPPPPDEPTSVYLPTAGVAQASRAWGEPSRPVPRCRMVRSLATESPSRGFLALLLHRRLRIASLIILTPFIYFLARSYLRPEPEFHAPRFLHAIHIALTLVFSGFTAVLWSRLPLGLHALRGIEITFFGLLSGFFAWTQFHQFTSEWLFAGADLLRTDPQTTGIHLVQLMAEATTLRWFFLIVLYGVFIPNTWKRCAAVVGAGALLPVVLTAAGAEYQGRFDHHLLEALEDQAILMAVAAAVAVFGSYRIHALEEKALEARQLGQYRLKRRLGAGGMGEVYLAEHVLLRRPCAVKLIRPDQAGDPTNLQRFEREVRAMATLTHWNTVEVFDYGHAEDGTFYYVMEYLPGLSLETLVSRQGPLPAERAVHFLRQTCHALREAHGIGLLHRDIKPSNIIACERGGVFDVAKLLDFGLVQGGGFGKQADRLTIQGTILGSPPYMSPEQAAGRSCDARSDVYSLGAVGYYLLTGQPPFPRETPMETLLAHAYEPVIAPAVIREGVPADVQQVILRCLEKHPEARYTDVDSLEKALGQTAAAGCWTEERAASCWAGVGPTAEHPTVPQPALPTPLPLPTV